MRKALNENPLAQIGLIAALGLVGALLFMTRLGGGATEEPAQTAEPSPTATEAASGAATSGEVVPEPSTASVAPASPAMGEFEAGEGLPKPVVAAYESGKAIALLVVRKSGIDDAPVTLAVQLLRARPDVAVFVTSAGKISRYARITQGVSVNRVPALIVIKPRKLSDGIPTASVSYGFRGPAGIVQAVEDATYKGRKLPYYPE